tara:strand:+ start:986 stop:1465 length:480 start_codon:yes stop_codon:yes gene_type:complete
MTTNENLYAPNILSKKLSIKCDELDQNIDDLLKEKLIKSIGNRCLKEGYVNGDTINIISRTIGTINPNHFNGEVYYNVQYEAQICNPIKDMNIQCKIKNINQLGIMAEVDCLTIVVAKQYIDESRSLDSFSIGQDINISIVGSRFDLNDKYITIIGRLS